MKAGREIRIRPCTVILSGAEFHAKIEDPGCQSGNIYVSDSDSEYSVNCGAYARTIAQQTPSVEASNTAAALNRELALFAQPNPVANVGELMYYLDESQPFTLTINNIVGQPVFSMDHTGGVPFSNRRTRPNGKF